MGPGCSDLCSFGFLPSLSESLDESFVFSFEKSAFSSDCPRVPACERYSNQKIRVGPTEQKLSTGSLAQRAFKKDGTVRERLFFRRAAFAESSQVSAGFLDYGSSIDRSLTIELGRIGMLYEIGVHVLVRPNRRDVLLPRVRTCAWITVDVDRSLAFFS